MGKYVTICMFLIANFQGFTQKLSADILNNLKYESRDGTYKAYLKKNIVNDLNFSDNKGNSIKFNAKYIEMEYGEMLKNEDRKLDFFLNIIREHQQDKNYKASYTVDILNRITIEDNRNRKLEIAKDVFGNTTYNEENKGEEKTLKKNIHGVWEYQSDTGNASLKRNISNIWIYKDSRGNEFKLGDGTWRTLKSRFKTEEHIFHYFIHSFLYIENCDGRNIRK